MLHALDQGEHFVRVDKLQIRRDINKGDTIDATLEILAYEALGFAS